MHFKTVAIIGRYQDSGIQAPIQQLAHCLQQAGCEVLLEYDTAQNVGLHTLPALNYKEIGSRADLAIVMGGDGTLLGAARWLAPYSVPLVGINLGRLGFITDIPLQDASNALSRILQGDFSFEDRTMLEGQVLRDEKTMFSGVALNDVILNRAGRGGMIEVQVEYNQQFMYTQRADGLIVSTPTGSTAYSLSANGPIIHPQLNAVLLVPVAPQTLSNRPIVLPDSGTISLTINTLGRMEAGASVHFDMQTWSQCQPGDKVEVRRAKHKVRLLHPSGYQFFSTLRRKLHWNRIPQLTDDIE